MAVADQAVIRLFWSRMSLNNLLGDSCLREVVEGVGWTAVLPGGMVALVDGTRHHRNWGCAYFFLMDSRAKATPLGYSCRLRVRRGFVLLEWWRCSGVQGSE